MTTTQVYDFPRIGCYVDTSAQSADDCNTQTIEFAQAYGFKGGLLTGYFDGLRGRFLEMSLEDAQSASHQGKCDEDVEALASESHIAAQLDKLTPDEVRESIKECGAWTAEELADDTQNRLRAVWLAAGDVKENASEQLSELADDAVNFLNDLETRSFLSWSFEDNSLFLLPDVDGAKEDVGFVSHADDNWTEECYCEREQDGFGKWKIVSKDASYPASDYRGEWLHVNDHGNVTLFVRDSSGKDKEIWACV
jgi:hypothetical protein